MNYLLILIKGIVFGTERACYVKYLKYVLRHKLFVYRAGRVLNVGFWQLLIHDWSKFKPFQFVGYARYFYKPDGSDYTRDEQRSEAITSDFNRAWNEHIHNNPHHWQYWILTLESTKGILLEIPDIYVFEMLADWIGAGRAQGRNDLRKWFETREGLEQRMHPTSYQFVRSLVEALDAGNGVYLW